MAGPATAFKAILVAGQVVWMGILVGVLVWAFGLFLWFAPSQRQVVSVLIVVLALASFISSDLGGFFIGMLLAIVGGAMGFAWVPAKIKKTKTRKVAASTESNPEASQPTFRAEWPAAPSAPQVDPSQPLT